MADRLAFHRSLYAPEAVDAAAEAFGHLATLGVERREHEIVVSVEAVDGRVADRFVDAFCNHVLYETVVRARAVAGAP